MMKNSVVCDVVAVIGGVTFKRLRCCMRICVIFRNRFGSILLPIFSTTKEWVTEAVRTSVDVIPTVSMTEPFSQEEIDNLPT